MRRRPSGARGQAPARRVVVLLLAVMTLALSAPAPASSSTGGADRPLLTPATSAPALPPEPSDPYASRSGAAVSALLGVREAAAVATADRERTALWGWPLAGTPEIVHGFDPPAQRWGPGHRGIDLAGMSGESVLAVEDGVVTYSGVVAGVGVVSVTHADGLRSTYQPVEDRGARGSRVARGDVVGRLDLGGHCVLRDCLHLGAVRGRDGYVDPTPLLLGVELTLLPLG